MIAKISTLQQICKVFQNTTQHPCHVLKASLLFTENSHSIGNRVQGLLRSMQHGEAKWFNTKVATVCQCQFSFSSKNQEERPTKLHKYCGLTHSLLLLLLVMWLQRRNNLAHISVGEGLILNSVPKPKVNCNIHLTTLTETLDEPDMPSYSEFVFLNHTCHIA